MTQDQTGQDEQIETSERSVTKALLAGMIGGIVATAAKSVAERAFPPRTHGEPEPPEVLANKLAGELATRPLTGSETAAAAQTIHWGFGAAVGAMYGVVAEYFPAATDKDGASFGMALATLTHEGALPAMGLAAAVADQTTREQASEMASHVVFGVVAESVRRFVRKLL